jgi:hypothetical protein
MVQSWQVEPRATRSSQHYNQQAAARNTLKALRRKLSRVTKLWRTYKLLRMNNYNNNLTILQYNVNHSNNKIQTPFLQQLNPKEHDIIAIQEPWINLQNKKTVNLPGYHTILPDAPAPRVAFYVSREISTLSWSLIKQTSDLITIQLQKSQNIQIHNCYNPSGPISHHNQGTLLQVQEALQAGEGCEKILLGDFNLHHPRWGGQYSYRSALGC